MKVTFTLQNLTAAFYNGCEYGTFKGLLQMTDIEKFKFLSSLAAKRELKIKMKIGNDQMREKVELNEILQKADIDCIGTIEPRKGYKLATFSIV